MSRTISEVIAELEAIRAEHGDVVVLINGAEGGYDHPVEIAAHTMFEANSGNPYEGRYEQDYGVAETRSPEATRFGAVVIGSN